AGILQDDQQRLHARDVDLALLGVEGRGHEQEEEQRPPHRLQYTSSPMQTASPGAEVGVGTVLGGSYEITGLIGRGGMGAVWSARHLRLPKKVAVKVLLTAVTAEGDAYARFRREAEVASKLGHPNIIEVLDFDVLPSGTPYLVLELLDGESLATRLRRGP